MLRMKLRMKRTLNTTHLLCTAANSLLSIQSINIKNCQTVNLPPGEYKIHFISSRRLDKMQMLPVDNFMVKQKITVVSCTFLVIKQTAIIPWNCQGRPGGGDLSLIGREKCGGQQSLLSYEEAGSHSRAELQTEGEILTAIVIQMLILF